MFQNVIKVLTPKTKVRKWGHIGDSEKTSTSDRNMPICNYLITRNKYNLIIYHRSCLNNV